MAADTVFAGKDWIYLAGVLVTFATFIWKLSADSKYARYRETIAFMEKREKDMRDRWTRISQRTGSEKEIEDDVYVFMEQLELVSLLVHKKAFDGELVYSSWWRYFDEPLQSAQINNWMLFRQTIDSSLNSQYVALCKKWSRRIDREQGRKT